MRAAYVRSCDKTFFYDTDGRCCCTYYYFVFHRVPTQLAALAFGTKFCVFFKEPEQTQQKSVIIIRIIFSKCAHYYYHRHPRIIIIRRRNTGQLALAALDALLFIHERRVFRVWPCGMPAGVQLCYLRIMT